MRVLNEQIVRGDFFLCATEVQRQSVDRSARGASGASIPIPTTVTRRLCSLIAVCPFGLARGRRSATRPAIRGVVPGIGADDKVILWAGGVYNWFDPLTLVARSTGSAHEHPDVRLFFLGMKHPNPGVPEMSMA